MVLPLRMPAGGNSSWPLHKLDPGYRPPRPRLWENSAPNGAGGIASCGRARLRPRGWGTGRLAGSRGRSRAARVEGRSHHDSHRSDTSACPFGLPRPPPATQPRPPGNKAATEWETTTPQRTIVVGGARTRRPFYVSSFTGISAWYATGSASVAGQTVGGVRDQCASGQCPALIIFEIQQTPHFDLCQISRLANARDIWPQLRGDRYNAPRTSNLETNEQAGRQRLNPADVEKLQTLNSDGIRMLNIYLIIYCNVKVRVRLVALSYLLKLFFH